MKGSIDDLVDRAPDGEIAFDAGMHRYIYRGNWKLQVENVLDSYHVPFGHASTVNKQGVQFARREGDKAGAAVIETKEKKTASAWKERKSFTVGNGHGWTSNTKLADGERSSAAFDAYKQALADKAGAERAAEILRPRLHNSLIYPDLSIMGLNIHVRVIKPLAVDLTEVTILPDPTRRRSNSMNFGNIRLLNVTHSAASFVQTDDLESFTRAQIGLRSTATDWVDISRGLGAEEPDSEINGMRGLRHARDGRARTVQGLARLHAGERVMAGAKTIDRAPFEAFLINEARLLDDRRFREWMDLFTDDGTYWVPASPGQASPFTEASLFFDDRELMKTRIDRLEHPLIHIQTPPSRTAHIVGNITVAASAEHNGEFDVTSTVIMVEYREERRRISPAASCTGCVPPATASLSRTRRSSS